MNTTLKMHNFNCRETMKAHHHHSPCIASFEEEEEGPSQKEYDPQGDQGENLTSSQMCCCYDGGKAQQL